MVSVLASSQQHNEVHAAPG